jgi:tetratricopeptide (TPR) repeat protein
MFRLALVLGLSLAAASASAQDLQHSRARCMNPDLEIKIEGCSSVILSGQESPANLAVAYSNRAAAYDAKGQHDQAIADAAKAIALHPGYADAYNERAWAYHGKGQDALGLPDAEQAVALAPTDAFSLETRAEIHERLGDRAGAIADYRAALTLAPGLEPARDGLKRLGVAPN